jgi:S-methylmethionine-dependent homocysteine/selenocysteine methylase
MISFSEFYLIKEAFDTVTEFMLNPENSDKDYDELIAEFEASGGEVIGSVCSKSFLLG